MSLTFALTLRVECSICSLTSVQKSSPSRSATSHQLLGGAPVATRRRSGGGGPIDASSTKRAVAAMARQLPRALEGVGPETPGQVIRPISWSFHSVSNGLRLVSTMRPIRPFSSCRARSASHRFRRHAVLCERRGITPEVPARRPA